MYDREGVVLSTAYPDSVRYLYALGNEHHSIKLGLERMQTVLDELGRPERAFRSVHVAGTNGKGSTCAMIESALRASGLRTGIYVSPHLVQPTERIRVSGVAVEEEEFTSAFEVVHAVCERLQKSGHIDMHTTYFETLTLMGFLLFRSAGVQTAVLEVGMGGRLDATNVVDPALSVITPIDFDHEKYLGTTIPQIAAEKAGIIKPGRPVVVSAQRPEAFEVCEAQAEAEGSRLIDACEFEVKDLELTPDGSRFRIHKNEIDLALIGRHQVQNAQTAVAALETLGVEPRAVERGLAAARWPGRLEFIRRNPDILLDGAHNPAGAAALAAYLQQFQQGRRIHMIFSAMHDKDLHALGSMLFPYASRLVFTAPDNSRAWPPEEMREVTHQLDAGVAPTPREALELVLAEASAGDLILVTGSLYLVGEVRGLLLS